MGVHDVVAVCGPPAAIDGASSRLSVQFTVARSDTSTSFVTAWRSTTGSIGAPTSQSRGEALLWIDERAHASLPSSLDPGAAIEHAVSVDAALLVVGPASIQGYRAVSGEAPFYSWTDGHVIVVATSVVGLLATGLVPPVADPLVTTMFNRGAFHFPYGRGFVRDSRVVPRGHSFELVATGMATRARFSPRDLVPTEPSEERAADLAASLRERLLEVLKRDLATDQPNLLLLSGGLDSSGLAVLAAREIGATIDTVSVLPSEGPFIERELQRVLRARRLAGTGASHEWPHGLTGRFEDEREPPLPVPIVGPFLPRLGRFEGTHATLLGGEHADSVCGGAMCIPDWAATTTAGQVARGLGTLPRGLQDIRRWQRWHEQGPRELLPYPSAIDEPGSSIQDEYAQWLIDYRLATSEWADASRRWLHLTSEQDGWLALYWEVCIDAGLRRILPFMDKEVLEIGYSSHPRDLMGPGLKRVLRDALRGLVPDEILDDRGRGNWVPTWWRVLPGRMPRPPRRRGSQELVGAIEQAMRMAATPATR